MLVTYWQPVAVITLAVIAGKILTCSFGAFIGGNNRRNSLRVGMGLAQIGEFSFIIGSLGLTLNLPSKFLYPVAVAVSSITTLLTPFLIESAAGLADGFHRKAPAMGDADGSQYHAHCRSVYRRLCDSTSSNLVDAVAVATPAAMRSPGPATQAPATRMPAT